MHFNDNSGLLLLYDKAVSEMGQNVRAALFPTALTVSSVSAFVRSKKVSQKTAAAKARLAGNVRLVLLRSGYAKPDIECS